MGISAFKPCEEQWIALRGSSHLLLPQTTCGVLEPTDGVLVMVLLLRTDTVINANLIKTFNWGWLRGSEAQFIIIKAGVWQYPDRHGTGEGESSTSSSEGC